MRRIELAEYKELVLKILEKIDEICQKNNLQYIIFYGTLLGAIRHGGFIPWDDDVDILMPRADYDKVRTIITKNDFGINFIDIETEISTVYAYGKICDKRTIVIDKIFKDVRGYGAFVDVFPLDNFPNDKKARDKILKKGYLFNRLRAMAARKKPTKKITITKRIRGWTAYIVGKFINLRKVLRTIDKISREANEKYSDSNYMGVVTLSTKSVFLKDDLFPQKNVKFENRIFKGPNNSEQLLTQLYGDYLQLPPEDQRVAHGLDCFENSL